MSIAAGFWIMPLHAGVLASHWLGHLAAIARVAGLIIRRQGTRGRRPMPRPPASVATPRGRSLIARLLPDWAPTGAPTTARWLALATPPAPARPV